MQSYTFGVNVNKLKNICTTFINNESKNFNLTNNQAIFLKFLSDPCCPSQKEICNIVGCDKAQASRVLQELKEKELITEQVDTKDNRKKSYQVTQKGREIYQHIDKQLSSLIDNVLLEDFSLEQKKQFFVLLDKMMINLNNYIKEEK